MDLEVTSGSLTINLGSATTPLTIGTSGITVFTPSAGTGTNVVITFPANGFSGRIRSIAVKGFSVIAYNFLNLPEKVSQGADKYMTYIYDATGRKLAQEVFAFTKVQQKKTDYAGEFIYENDTLQFINHEEGRVILKDTASEYQYHLKDHLGNVRLTFTTKEEIDNATATLETQNSDNERSKFLYYDDAIKIYEPLFDHTNNPIPPSGGGSGPGGGGRPGSGGPGAYYGYATRLTGGNTDAIYGLARSISVMPGDVIRAEVFAKYIDTDTSNWETELAELMASIANNTAPPGTVVDGGAPGSIGGVFPYAGVLTHADNGEGPKAYLIISSSTAILSSRPAALNAFHPRHGKPAPTCPTSV